MDRSELFQILLRYRLEAGELSQFDLVTRCQGEEYDLDGGGPDAQVDTGKRKRLYQAWQL